MPHRHQKSIYVNLEIEPSELSADVQSNPNHWYTLGDLHGNALKLLHFLKLQGAAQMGEPGHYARFVEIYNKSVSKLTQEDMNDLHQIIHGITITPTAHIRLLGDDLCDRGSNDYFTLLLLEKLFDGTSKEGNVEILLSNHTDSFIHCQEKNLPYHLNPLSASDPRYRHLGISACNLQSLIYRNLTTKKSVDAVYEKYKTKLKAISYEVNEQGEISSIYTHAAMGEEDIFQMGVGLSNYSVTDEYRDLFTDDQRSRLSVIRLTIQNRNRRNGTASKHLAELIDLINDIAAYNAHNNTLNRLMNMGPRLTRTQANGSELNANIHPYYMLVWNRTPRNDRKLNERRSCPILYVHGHDLGTHNLNPKRKSHDNMLGKGKNPEGLLEYSCTDSTSYKMAEPQEVVTNPNDDVGIKTAALIKVPVVGASVAAATSLSPIISKIPFTEGILLDMLLLPYLTGKLVYWLNYGVRTVCADEDVDSRRIAKDSSNLQWQVTWGMACMEACKHLAEFFITFLKQVDVDVKNKFFEQALLMTTNVVKRCPVEFKGALMLVSGLGFAIGATIAKWHQTHKRLQGFSLFAELAITFCFGFIVGAAAAIGYKNEVATVLMPAATTATLLMGVSHKWMTPNHTPTIIPAAQKNDDPQSSSPLMIAHTQT